MRGGERRESPSDKSILERGEGVVGSKRKADEIGVIIDAWGTCGNV